MINFPFNKPIFILAGPTAVGKTALSIRIAKEFNCEIISVDSMQIYKRMNIGTAKVTKEEMEGIPHHLIDIIEPDEDYDASCFLRDAQQAIVNITQKGKIPLLTGGTGLYYKSLLEGLAQNIPAFPEIRKQLTKEYIDENRGGELHKFVASVDPRSANRLHKNDTSRLLRAAEIYLGTGTPWSQWIDKHQLEKEKPRFTDVKAVCLNSEREELYQRINMRCEIMINAGLGDEVKNLLSMGFSPELKSMSSIGYKHMVQYLLKEIDKNIMLETMSRDTRRYAKRQFTWFKKMKEMVWIDVNKEESIISFYRNTKP